MANDKAEMMQDDRYHSSMSFSQQLGYGQWAAESPQWSSTLGPLGPLATYSNPLSQTLPSGQVQWAPQGTPNRQAKAPAARSDTSTAGSDKRLEPASGEEELREILARAKIDETRATWLIEEGFTSYQLLRLLTLEGVEEIMDKHNDEQCPMAQSLALKHLVRSMNQAAEGYGAPRNPQRKTAPPPPREDLLTGRRDPWDPELIRGVLAESANNWRRDVDPKLDYQDPTVLMRLQGKHATYHDITDFVPGFIIEKERVTLPGSEGKVVLETGPRKPLLHKITIPQWNCANARILDTLILDGNSLNAVPDYLAYTQKVNRMAERFEWETILLFDREYRQLQSTVGMRWGVDVRHLSDIHLREKVQGLSQGQARRDRQNRNSGKPRNNAVDPNSGKELCLNFNRGQCLYQNCKYAHVCSQCFEGHAATTHGNQGNPKGH